MDKVRKPITAQQTFIAQESQLHISAQIRRHHQADYENKNEKFSAAWV
jgi:hypothetical protein